jgi:DNA replicative helicase MCM subunit Mcm2 (Cdc46/Mcm family)
LNDRCAPMHCDVVSKISAVCDMWIDGKMYCSDCGEVIEVAGSHRKMYFAGRFCENCWERKWKAIEARENYD